MKRKNLIKQLEGAVCILLRHGAKHDIYHNPLTGMSEPIPRHREIHERLAHRILKHLVENQRLS